MKEKEKGGKSRKKWVIITYSLSMQLQMFVNELFGPWGGIDRRHFISAINSIDRLVPADRTLTDMSPEHSCICNLGK